MAFRGRGRGGFGRGRGFGFGGGRGTRAKEEPFILFPEDVELPGIRELSAEDVALIARKVNLQRYWESSPYYIRDKGPKAGLQSVDVERYSHKPEAQERRLGSLSSFLNLTGAHFPAELITGAKLVKHDRKRTKWDLEPGLRKIVFFIALLNLQKLDMLEKLEGENKRGLPYVVVSAHSDLVVACEYADLVVGKDPKSMKPKKDEEENEEEVGSEDEEEEEEDDGDYNQNFDFDDDEDDLNPDDDGADDEPAYDV
ncbi:hypothetical protein ACLOJK_013953 [Asimina triloba]